jgi:hypothetical protein
MDFNDPRNRADSMLDLTVIGYPIPFTAGSDKVNEHIFTLDRYLEVIFKANSIVGLTAMLPRTQIIQYKKQHHDLLIIFTTLFNFHTRTSGLNVTFFENNIAQHFHQIITVTVQFIHPKKHLRSHFIHLPKHFGSFKNYQKQTTYYPHHNLWLECSLYLKKTFYN